MSNNNEKLVYHTDRSRIVSYRRCPRARYWGYEFEVPEVEGVPGVVPGGVNLPMTIGSAVHQGLEMLHIMQLPSVGPKVEIDEPVEYAVTQALDYFNGQVMAEENAVLDMAQDVAQDEFAFLDAPAGAEDQGRRREFKIREARAMVEALVRSYYKVGLPVLLEKYEVLLVENEMSSLLVDQADLAVQLNGRSDALLREPTTGSLAILSIKTAKDLDARSSRNWMEDDQGISECYLIREMARAGKLAQFGISDFDDVQVGVQMLYLLKGKEYKDDKDGIWKHGHPVVRPFSQESPGGDVELRPKWNWVDDTGKDRVLGKGWRATPIWDTGRDISQWIDEIHMQHEGVLEATVLLPELYIRTNEEMDNWAMEAALQELNLATVKLDMQREESVNLEMLLAGEFPKHRNSCNYPVACEYKVLCHPVCGELGMSSVGEMLMSGGLVQVEGYTRRIANHVQEEGKDV